MVVLFPVEALTSVEHPQSNASQPSARSVLIKQNNTTATVTLPHHQPQSLSDDYRSDQDSDHARTTLQQWHAGTLARKAAHRTITKRKPRRPQAEKKKKNRSENLTGHIGLLDRIRGHVDGGQIKRAEPDSLLDTRRCRCRCCSSYCRRRLRRTFLYRFHRLYGVTTAETREERGVTREFRVRAVTKKETL